MTTNNITQKEFKTGGGAALFTLIICSLLYMVNYMDRQVFAVALEPMKQELRLTDSQLGIIGTVFLLSIAFFALPAGLLMDRWSRRKAVGITAIGWSIFTYVTGLGKGFWGIFIPRSMVGVGEAGFSAGGTAMITAAYPPESRSKAMGVFNMFIMLGIALGMILGGIIVTAYGWRMPFFVFAVPGVILGIIAFFLKDYKTVKEVDGLGKKVGFFATVASLFRIPTLKWLFIGYAMQNVLAFSYLQWTAAYLMRCRDLTAADAGKIIGIMSFGALIGSPLGGFLADKWQKKNARGRMLLPVCTMIVMTALWVPSVILQFEGLGFVSGILFGTTVMMGLPALSAITQDVVTPGLKATSWGMCVLCMYVLGGGWAPYLTGAISDALGGGAYGLKVALLIASIGGVLATICLYIGSRHYEEDVVKVSGVVLEAE